MESKESYRKRQENELEVIQVSKSVLFNIVINFKNEQKMKMNGAKKNPYFIRKCRKSKN